MKNLFLFLLIVGFSVISFAQEPEWKSIEADKYSLQYPSEWQLDQSGLMGTKFIIFAPQASNSDKFKENVNLISQDLTGKNVTLEQYVELSVQQVKLMIPNCKMVENELIKKDDLEFHKIQYTGDQGPFNLTFKQYLFFQNEIAFVITLTCEQSEFENYKEVGSKILDSFTLKN